MAPPAPKYGITPYGTETMHVLRAEKGYIIVGQDTDGTVTPQDAGMEWVVSKAKDFIGKRSYTRADAGARGPQAPGQRAARWTARMRLPEGSPARGKGHHRQPRLRPRADAGPRDLELPQRRAGQVVRPGPDQERPQPHRRDPGGRRRRPARRRRRRRNRTF